VTPTPAAPGRADHGTPRRRGGRRRRSWIAGTLSIALVVALIVLAIVKLDPAAVLSSLTSVAAGWAVLGVGLMATAFLARGESWFAVIQAALPDAPVGRLAVLRALLIGMAASTVAPARAGEAARAWVIGRRVGDPRQVLATVAGTILAQTLINLFALSILAGIALSDAAITHARLASLAVALALPAGILTVLFAGPSALRRASGTRHHRLRRPVDWLSRQLDQARSGLAAFRTPATAAHATAAQLAAWTLQLGTCYALMLALHLTERANLAAAATVLVAVNLTAILPVTPSNVGIFQAGCIAALTPFGVTATHALAYGILLQGVEVFCALMLGAPALVQEGVFRTIRHTSEPISQLGSPGTPARPQAGSSRGHDRRDSPQPTPD
jgi:phosphatidylinositol alpha-mannosyltransferase